MKRCPCCKHWIGPITLLTAGMRVACPSCWAIFKRDMMNGTAAGIVLGFLVIPLPMILAGPHRFEELMAYRGGGRVFFGAPFLFAFLGARLFAKLELEEPPTDSVSKSDES